MGILNEKRCNTLDDKDKYQKFVCNHFFHKNCIQQWNGPCPLCRINITI